MNEVLSRSTLPSSELF